MIVPSCFLPCIKLMCVIISLFPITRVWLSVYQATTQSQQGLQAALPKNATNYITNWLIIHFQFCTMRSGKLSRYTSPGHSSMNSPERAATRVTVTPNVITVSGARHIYQQHMQRLWSHTQKKQHFVQAVTLRCYIPVTSDACRRREAGFRLFMSGSWCVPRVTNDIEHHDRLDL